MNRQILLECAPYFALLLASLGLAWLLARLTHTRPDWRHLGNLGRDERGAVQSLSFVLTVPAFVMIMMFIVQLSQLTVAKVVVEYAALATARSAQVWIPADLSDVGGGEPNEVVCLQPVGDLVGPDGWFYTVYRVPPVGVKYHKIRQAAVQAIIPICPSRDTGYPLDADAGQIARSLQSATLTYAPGLAANPRVEDRLRNKLAYALASTNVEIEVRHKEDEPPLRTYLIGPYFDEFDCGEIGWHDQLIVTVTHEFALLPGPGRLLARRSVVPSPSTTVGATTSGTTPGVSTDAVADRIRPVNGVYTYTLSATARLYNEGQKPRLRYRQTYPGPALALRAGGVAPVASPPRGEPPQRNPAYREHAGMTNHRGMPLTGPIPGTAATSHATPSNATPGSTTPGSTAPAPLNAPRDSTFLDALPSVLRGSNP